MCLLGLSIRVNVFHVNGRCKAKSLTFIMFTDFVRLRFRFTTLYHPNLGVWESLASPPSTFINIHSAVRVSRCIYFVEVANCQGNNKKLMCYNTRKNKWSEIAKIQFEPKEPDADRTHDVSLFRSKNTLYATVSSITSGNVLYKYHNTEDTWTKVSQL